MSQKPKKKGKRKEKRYKIKMAVETVEPSSTTWYSTLREEYLQKGGEGIMFDAMLVAEDLPGWSKAWNSLDDEDYAGRLEEAVKRHLLDAFVEYEVIDRSGVVVGTAICKVAEVRTAKGQTALRIIHLAASDERYEAWAQDNFNIESGYQLHLCKKVDGDGSCVARPLSGKVTWCHVRKWRLLSLLDCGELAYAKAAATDWLVKRLQECEAEEERKRADKREPLVETKEGEAGKPVLPGPGEGRELVPQFGDAVQKTRDRTARASEKARETAGRAARALTKGEPAMLKVAPRMKLGTPRAVREKVEEPNRGRSPVRQDLSLKHRVEGDWRDGTSALEMSERKSPAPSVGRNGPPDRQRSRSRGRGGGGDKADPGGGGRRPGGNGGSGGNDPGRSRSRREKPPSDEEELPKVRAALVVPPRRRKRKRNPDDSPGSSGGSKRGSGRDKDKKRKKKHERDDSREKRRRRRSSSSKSSGGSDEDFYGKESRKFASLLQKAQKHPGKLLRSGLEEMKRYLVARSGEDNQAGVSWRNQRVTAYLSQVLFTQYSPQTLGARNSREFLTLAEAIDQLMSQNFAAVGDLLMQRFKALESSLGQGWSVAKHQELIRPEHATLTRPEELAFAARAALQQSKLEEAVKRRRSG